VVLVEFWTYTCSNCLNVAPYVHQWHARYASQGLRVIGVHTPEFAYEGLPGNVRRAIARLDITWPVVQDNQYRIWNAWGNRFWLRCTCSTGRGGWSTAITARATTHVPKARSSACWPTPEPRYHGRAAPLTSVFIENAMNHVPHPGRRR
jgi:thiol-disulfide isomerase/thioredoxin